MKWYSPIFIVTVVLVIVLLVGWGFYENKDLDFRKPAPQTVKSITPIHSSSSVPIYSESSSTPTTAPTESQHLSVPSASNIAAEPHHSTSVDVSAVDIAVTPSSFSITDPAMRRTGRDPITGQQIQDIPESTYFEDRIGSSDVSCFAQISHPVEGNYMIVLTAVHDGPYEVSVNVFARDRRASSTSLLKTGEIKAGSHLYFILALTLTPGQQSTLTLSPDSSTLKE